MLSKFRGKCATCGGAIEAGIEIDYDGAKRQAHHVACRNNGSSDGNGTAESIADQCGFIPSQEAMAADWVLRCMRPSDRSDATRGTEPTALSWQVADLFGEK